MFYKFNTSVFNTKYAIKLFFNKMFEGDMPN